MKFIILLLPVKEAKEASEMLCISNMPWTMDNVKCNILIKGHAFMQFKDTV